MLPKDVEQVLIGSLLGDGSVCVRRDCKNAKFAENHSIRQLDYLKWKAEILSPHFGGRVGIWVNGEYKKAMFCTRVHPTFTELRRLWYPDGKKILPEGELQKLNELGLAVWYQDDGSYNYWARCCRISIDGFKGREFAIQRWFEERWGLSPHITSGPSLQLSVKDSDRFLHSITEYVHPSMTYKLGHLHPANQTRIERARMENHEWYMENRDKISQRERGYYQKHQDRILKQRREYHLKHRDEILQRKREYRLKNRERILQRSREYYKKNRDKFSVYGREYREKNKDIILRRTREYYRRNRDRLVQYARDYRRKKRGE